MTYYGHPAVEAPLEPGETIRECRACGKPVIGYGPDVRHDGETVRTTAVPREYLHAFQGAVSAAELALSRVTERASDEERARVAVAAILEAGYLRPKQVKPKVKTRP